MNVPDPASPLEQQIEAWRTFVRRRQAIHAADVSELEDNLREQIAALQHGGLAPEEAFLVAVKRMGKLDAVSREFAAEHSERLWKQLVVVQPEESQPSQTREGRIAFACAVAAGASVKAPALFGLTLDNHTELYVRNATLLVLPWLVAYFAWKRSLPSGILIRIAGLFLLGFLAANVLPRLAGDDGTVLVALHLPLLLWLGVGLAYAGTRWQEVAGRMDFIRFTGELLIYFALIALGGGVLAGFTALTFTSIGINVGPFFGFWLIPVGAAGAVIVASWLVEAKQSVVENMAPVLTRLFTPLFALMLLAFIVARTWSDHGMEFHRDLLIGFDLLLVVVIGLVLYSLSARDPQSAPGAFDWAQVVLIVAALVANGLALWSIGSRISEFGFTPNRVAALGENILLLVNLAGSAILYLRFIAGQSSLRPLEKWQTSFLPIYAAWAGFVVLAFPTVFR